MRSGSYQLVLSIAWLLAAIVFLLRDAMWSEEWKSRFNPPQMWLFVTVALAMSLWNGMRWYARKSRRTDSVDWNPFARR